MSNLQAKITAKEESILEAKSELKALKKEVKTTKDPKLTKWGVPMFLEDCVYVWPSHIS